jgi:hypothetical protein
MSDTRMASTPAGGRGERRNDALALRLLELAVGAGWKPRECIEFAREAYKFLTLTRAVHQTVAVAEDIAADETVRSDKLVSTSAPSPHPANCPEWSSDFEIRRRALQTLADRNLMMKDAAELLGISLATVAYTAHKLKIRFHGRRDSRKFHPAPGNTKAVARNGSPPPAQINGLAIPKLLAPLDKGVRRRCPSCNQIFEPAEVSHHLCDDCEGGGHAGRS